MIKRAEECWFSQEHEREDESDIVEGGDDSAVTLINVFTRPSAISVRASYCSAHGQTGNTEEPK